MIAASVSERGNLRRGVADSVQSHSHVLAKRRRRWFNFPSASFFVAICDDGNSPHLSCRLSVGFMQFTFAGNRTNSVVVRSFISRPPPHSCFALIPARNTLERL